MKYRTRTYYTDGQKALMWERWRQGWTLHQIAHLFNRAHTSVRGVLAQTGGIRPPPRSRGRSSNHSDRPWPAPTCGLRLRSVWVRMARRQRQPSERPPALP